MWRYIVLLAVVLCISFAGRGQLLAVRHLERGVIERALHGAKRDLLPRYRTPRNFSPLRLHVHWVENDPWECRGVGQATDVGECQEEDILTTQGRDTVTAVMEQVKIRIAEIVAVDRGVGNFRADANFYYALPQCQKLPIPVGIVFGEGIPDIDFFVVLTTRPYHPGVLAYANVCNMGVFRDGRLGRPLVAGVNLTPRHFNGNSSRKYSEEIVLHEIIHALGFMGELYEHFHDRSGRIYQDPIIEKFRRGHIVRYLATPAVRAWARWHFDCSELEGAELEDWDARGYPTTSLDPGSHWEERVFGPEIMTPVAYLGHMPLSGLTLAFLDDTGWYLTNKSTAQPLAFGRGEGCDFALEHCNHSSWKKYVCREPGMLCSVHHDVMGMCDITTHPEGYIPIYYLFDPTNPILGGFKEHADFCPRIFATSSCEDTTSVVANDNEITLRGESSRCVEMGDELVGCVKTVCSPGQPPLLITATENIDCSVEEGANVSGIFVHCPRDEATPFCPLGELYQPPAESGSDEGIEPMVGLLILIQFILLTV